jgi:hypothetical protein
MIQARVKLSAPPDVVFGVLTDYANWPTLFPPGVEVKVTKCPTESYSSAKDVDCGMDSGISLPLGLTRGVGRPS